MCIRDRSRTAVQVGSLNKTNESEKSTCNERKRGNSVWLTGKIKSLPSEWVTSMIKTNVVAIQWNFNETGMQDGNGTWQLLCYKGTISVSYTHLDVYKRQEKKFHGDTTLNKRRVP